MNARPLAAAAVLSLLLTACSGGGSGGSPPASSGQSPSATSASTASDPSSGPTSGPTSAASGAAATGARLGGPSEDELDELSQRLVAASDGIEPVVESDNDPARPLTVAYPRVGAAALDTAVEQEARRQAEEFRADNAPGGVAPPALTLSWTLVAASDEVLGTRLRTHYLPGGSATTSHRTFYGTRDGRHSWPSPELLSPEGRAATAEDVVAAVSTRAEVFEDADTSPESVIGDLVALPDGGARVTVDEGALTAASEGALTVTLDAGTMAGRWSEAGEQVSGAVARAGAPGDVPTPTAASAPAADDTDCAAVRCIALTFDDGPAASTAAVVDAFRGTGAHATFFVLGQSVAAAPSTVQHAAAEGHEIGSHSWSHPQLTTLSAEEQRDQVERTDAALRAAGVAPTPLLRPPYGAYDKATQGLGKALIMWDVDTLDWKTRSTPRTVGAVLDGAHPGAIVLMHDIHPTTAAAVPQIIAGLKQRGYTLVTVSDLLDDPRPGRVYTARR